MLGQRDDDIFALVECILSGQVAQEHVPRLGAEVPGLVEALKAARDA